MYTGTMCTCAGVGPPVQVTDQALLVAAQQLAQQLLVLPVETQVIGDREGLQRQAGEPFHQLAAAEMQAEVVASLGLARHNPRVL